MSVQCRTMLSQRPCTSGACTRPECSGGRVSAPQTQEAQEPSYSLTGLSELDLGLLSDALYALNNHATVGEQHDRIMDMVNKLYAAYDS